MNRAVVISPDIFLQHATKLRARRLRQVAITVPQDLFIHAVPPTPQPDRRRSNLSSVLRHFHSRIR